MTVLDQDVAAGDETSTPTGALRCSDAERERTSSLLHAAVGEGRLSLDELEERLAKLYASRYRHELEAVTADLPRQEKTTGWAPIVAQAHRQLMADLLVLTGRTGDPDRRRRLVLALVALGTLLSVLTMFWLALHGFGGDGPEHPDFGH